MSFLTPKLALSAVICIGAQTDPGEAGQPAGGLPPLSPMPGAGTVPEPSPPWVTIEVDEAVSELFGTSAWFDPEVASLAPVVEFAGGAGGGFVALLAHAATDVVATRASAMIHLEMWATMPARFPDRHGSQTCVTCVTCVTNPRIRGRAFIVGDWHCGRLGMRQ